MFDTLEPAEPTAFQIAWESTLLCNLDCSYCGDGHDNRTKHPDLESSLKTVDFIFEYTDLQMIRKPNHLQIASLNIQGGESLFHPSILEILQYVESKKSNFSWYMGTATITNAVVGPVLWEKISQYIDYYTISYHAESYKKQQELVRTNVLFLKNSNKKFHVAILMHPAHWDNCVAMIEWCKLNDIKYVVRQIDHHWLDFRFNYSTEQARYLTGLSLGDKLKAAITGKVNLSNSGRSCCGGNTLCAGGCNTDRVVNKFKGWHCSVDRFFLYIRQNTGEVFTNKDCRMNFNNTVGPIGNLNNAQLMLDQVKQGTNTIVCKKSSCWCGLCAPKAKTKTQFDQIICKYATAEDQDPSSH